MFTRACVLLASLNLAAGMCPAPAALTVHDTSVPLAGTVAMNDKPGQAVHVISFDKMTGRSIPLPYTAPHELVLGPDNRLAFINNYETLSTGGPEGSGVDGTYSSLVDIIEGEVITNVDVSDHPRPHGYTWLNETAVIATSQLKNELVVIELEGAGASIKGHVTDAFQTDCNTPHLVLPVVQPQDGSKVNRVITSCRGTNPTAPPHYPGKVSVMDPVTGAHRVLDANLGAEGMAVAPDGSSVWVLNARNNSVTIVDMGATLGEERVRATLELPSMNSPIRGSFTADGARVFVANYGSDDVSVFDAKTYELIKDIPLHDDTRGPGQPTTTFPIGEELMAVVSMNTASVFIFHQTSLNLVATLNLPRCSNPDRQMLNYKLTMGAPEVEDGKCEAHVVSPAEAKEKKLVGWNNWSGGECPYFTPSSGDDHRFNLIDGAVWTPLSVEW